MAVARGPIDSIAWLYDLRQRWPFTQLLHSRNVALLQPTGCYQFLDSDQSDTSSTTVTFNLNLGGPGTKYILLAVYQQTTVGPFTPTVNGQALTNLATLDAISLWGGTVTLGADPNALSWTATSSGFTTRFVHAFSISAANTTPLDAKITSGTTETTFAQTGDAIIAGLGRTSVSGTTFSGSTEVPAGERLEGLSIFSLTTADWTTNTNGTFSAIATNSGTVWI